MNSERSEPLLHTVENLPITYVDVEPPELEWLVGTNSKTAKHASFLPVRLISRVFPGRIDVSPHLSMFMICSGELCAISAVSGGGEEEVGRKLWFEELCSLNLFDLGLRQAETQGLR